jgi:hypothetical protein
MSSLVKQVEQRLGLLHGTLDKFLLRTLLYRPARGHQVGQIFSGAPTIFIQPAPCQDPRQLVVIQEYLTAT